MKKNNDCSLAIRLNKDRHHVFIVPFWSGEDKRLRVFINGDYAMMLSSDDSNQITGMPFVHPGISRQLQDKVIEAVTLEFFTDRPTAMPVGTEKNLSPTSALDQDA